MREFNLALQGHHDALSGRMRSEAGWMSMILSALTGEVVTPGQLLGEEALTVEDKTRDAAKDLKKLEKKMLKAGVNTKQLKAGS